MRITALEPHAGRPERLDLWIDGQLLGDLALDLVLAAGLRVGDPIDAAALEALERRDRVWRAREAALVLLSHRARSAAELRRRLLRKDFPPEVVDECLRDLGERGLVDDAAFAASYVRERVRFRPRGARRLVQELCARGVAGETAGAAVDEVLEAESLSEEALARHAAAAWLRRNQGRSRAPGAGDDARAARRRLYAFLARRGFSADAIRRALDAAAGAGN